MDKKIAYTVYVDVTGAPWAWVKDATDTTTYVGSYIADDSGWRGMHAISTELEQAFIEWALCVEKQLWLEYDEVDEDFDWQGLHAQGIDLSIRLKQEVGEEALVYYAREFRERIEVLPGGELRSFIADKPNFQDD